MAKTRPARSSAQRLQAIDEGLDRLASQLVDKVMDGARTHVRGWQREVGVAIGHLPVTRTGPTAGAITSRARIQEVQQALLNGANRVQQDGDKLIRQMGQMADAALRGLKVGGVPVTITNHPAIKAFGGMKRADLEAILRDLVQRSMDVVRTAITTRQLQGEVIVEVGEVLDLLPGRMSRWADTALMEYSQLLVALNAPDADAYLYSGPVDHRCRPFCLRHVGKVWTRDRIDRMDNGITANTFLTRGGPNCRHLWRPVTDTRLVNMANTGQYADPGMRARVQAASTVGKVVRKGPGFRAA